jgi:preprotein translocase subunit SecD
VAKHYQPRKSLLSLAIITLFLVVAVVVGNSHAPKLGTDLRGGTILMLSPVTDAKHPITGDQLGQTVDIIRQRVDGFGVAESTVATQGTGANAKIIVTIPGAVKPEAVDSLMTTAKLDFRQVLTYAAGTNQPAPSSSASVAPSGSSTAKATATAKPSVTPKATPTPTVPASWLVPPIQFSSPKDPHFAKTFAALDCAKFGQSTKGVQDDEKKYLVTCDQSHQLKYVLAPAELSGTDVQTASAGLPQQGAGGYEISLQLTSSGAQKFASTTTRLYKEKSPMNQFGIVLDGVIISAPKINEAILGGSAVISGSFTADSSKILAQQLKFGALPVTLALDEQTHTSAQLGNDQLQAALLAGLFGLLLVILYLVLYYRVLGLIAVASLIFAALWLYLGFILLGSQIGFTLTLAGIAGAIVAIGITADSFVVYFERIRDELREGKRLRSSVEHGWSRARRTILAADFVSFLAAVVLYFLSVGNVRGFAFTLGLTTVIDVAVAFLFTRPLVNILANGAWMNKGSAMTGVSPERLGAPTQTEVAQ